MFGIGGQELFFILLLALILLGPSKLPEIMKTFGKAMGEFQRASNDLKREIDIASQEKPAPDPAPAEKESPVQGDAPPEMKADPAEKPDPHPDEMKG